MKKILVLFVLCISLFMGCSKQPSWVKMGSVADMKGEGKCFMAKGMAGKSVKNAALRQDSADNRAIKNLQKQLQVYTDYDYSEVISSKDKAEKIKQSLKIKSTGVIKGVRIVDRWTDDEGTIYSLARYDLDTLKKVVEMTDADLTQEQLKAMYQRIDMIYEEMEKE